MVRKLSTICHNDVFKDFLSLDPFCNAYKYPSVCRKGQLQIGKSEVSFQLDETSAGRSQDLNTELKWSEN